MKFVINQSHGFKRVICFVLVALISFVGTFDTAYAGKKKQAKDKKQSAAAAKTQQTVDIVKDGLQTVLKQGDDVPAVMMSLVILSTDAQRKGQTPPVYNLCNVKINGEETFCHNNKGIPRIKMPQLKGVPVNGGKAAKMVQAKKLKLKHGQADLRAEFVKFVQSKGCKVTQETISVIQLKATQNELVGSEVAEKWFELKKDPNQKLQPIFVSGDNYILDGHHHWAALMAFSFGQTKLKDITMPVTKVDKTIDELLKLTDQFLQIYKIKGKGGN